MYQFLIITLQTNLSDRKYIIFLDLMQPGQTLSLTEAGKRLLSDTSPKKTMIFFNYFFKISVKILFIFNITYIYPTL